MILLNGTSCGWFNFSPLNLVGGSLKLLMGKLEAQFLSST